jgi:hypothetical protein
MTLKLEAHNTKHALVLPTLQTRLFFSSQEIEDYPRSRPELLEPVGRGQVLADVTSGNYFGEIAFTAMVKKMLQVPPKI